MELFENENRILVIKVSGRPLGKVYKFEDVPLMRVGEDLKPMSDEKHRSILNESEPDFSSKFCQELTIDDLDDEAIDNMKLAYSKKQNNPQFLTQSKIQVLVDLNLIKKDKLTFAALILLGTKEALSKFLPQSEVKLEYRNHSGQINFDNRKTYQKAYFILIDELWDTINLRNGKFPIQEGPYIFDIPFFQ